MKKKSKATPIIYLVCLAILAIFLIIFANSCGNNSSGNVSNSYSTNNGYSNTYNGNNEYKRNVDSVSDVYGVSSQEIDKTIQNTLNRYNNGK